MSQVGYLRVQLSPTGSVEDFDAWRLKTFQQIPGTTQQKFLTATDDPDPAKPYRSEVVYDIEDITKLDLDKLLQEWSSPVATITLVLYKRMDFAAHDGKEIPPEDGVIVANSLTPENDPDVLEDYHAWYRDEHIHKLMQIPGWRTGSRYQLLDRRGECAEYVGPFMAVHQYDRENGLGGPEFLKSVLSDWTKKIDKRMAKRPHRRVFKIDRCTLY
ncbi:hypothetical protein EDD37DRAFT_674883 [Exophiala viscosa]|uniref:Uncharacterized protein n=1 Tax=Exophiala viscosa TaxID=2486360 RepID=A0AAN6DMD2_9EURO|nr:hypothetical protein EDD36DRAFT_500128 [Exophiala viscosa]KAI1620063.1 hypothetical protein EDD37DRAFT_674883 [Exophiala viscosa]